MTNSAEGYEHYREWIEAVAQPIPAPEDTTNAEVRQ